MLKQMKHFSAKQNCDGKSARGHGTIQRPEIRIRKNPGFGVWLRTARAVPACSGVIRRERMSEIIVFAFLFRTLHACQRELQPFRLKLRLHRLLGLCCFMRKALGESRNIGLHLHKRCDYLTASSSLFMGQTSQTAFTAPVESLVSSTDIFPDFEVDVHHSTPVCELWSRLNSGSPW